MNEIVRKEYNRMYKNKVYKYYKTPGERDNSRWHAIQQLRFKRFMAGLPEIPEDEKETGDWYIKMLEDAVGDDCYDGNIHPLRTMTRTH
jgi:hypothetical protein